MTVLSGYRRGAALTLSGWVVVAGAIAAGAPVAWAEPGPDAVSAIDERYAAFGGEGSLLGAPVGEAVDVPGGAERPYVGGAIYYSKDTGAHVMYGAILERYKALGGPAGSGLGFPTNDESDTGDGTGRFNDFSAPAGASMYWTPQWGASVMKGRVLEAWRQSGAVTGPFGYPSADTSVVDGVQTGKFVGPEGTEIQWSQAAGLVTIPAGLAARIPGIGSATPTAEGTTSVTKPTLSGPATPESTTKSSRWWWIPVGIAAVALLAGLGRLLRRKPEAQPVRVAPARVPEVNKPTPPRAEPAVKATVPPAAPAPRPAPTPPPAKVVPLAKTPPPPRPAPVAAPPPPAPAPAPRTVVHTETGKDVTAVIRYASQTPAETTVRVTYENNAIGDDEKSVADKSDSIPDSRQL